MQSKKRVKRWISPSNRYINIKAESEYITIIETVPEEYAEERLKSIRDAFKYYDGTLDQKVLYTDNKKINALYKGKQTYFPHNTRVFFRKSPCDQDRRFKVEGAKLKVNFVHANPELPF